MEKEDMKSQKKKEIESILLRRSETLVIALVGKELSENWWNSYNKAFKMTPLEKSKTDIEEVYSYLMQHAEGQW